VKKDYSLLDWITKIIAAKWDVTPKTIVFALNVSEVKELYLYFWEELDLQENIQENR